MWHGCQLSAISLASPVCRLSAQAMQPSRVSYNTPLSPLLVEEVESPIDAEPDIGVQTPAGSALPEYHGPVRSTIQQRTWGEGGGQHGGVSAQPAQASHASHAALSQANLPRTVVQVGTASPRRGAQPGHTAAAWASFPGRQEGIREFMGQALASAQASAGTTESCGSMQQGLRPGDQAAGSQQGLSPAGRPARQLSGAVLPTSEVPKPREPAERPMGRRITSNAAWPPQVLLPPPSNAAPQPGATVSLPAQQAAAGAEAALGATYAAVCTTSQAVPGLSPPLPMSTESLFRHPQTTFQSAQPHRSQFDHTVQSEYKHPHSPFQLQPHPHHQPGPSHGAAAPQQHQTLPTQTVELLPTQPSGSAAAAQLQQHQTGLWGGQQPPSGHDIDIQVPAHGKARPLQPMGVIQELQQVLLEVRLMGVDDGPMPRLRNVPQGSQECVALSGADHHMEPVAHSPGLHCPWIALCETMRLYCRKMPRGMHSSNQSGR